ncbi:S-layer domain protein [Anaerovibrio sp. JC8]|uniref:S-layer homology domain-containing protein n=1 Tax=Anaerovibrio sp. JC8 TaxID=1240085 RepID=UPI000A0A7019|nr:S-layer homology domain-containing protein [Anaerovibrio sp. JC8]ORU00977.1 S-layer domain protein [Anaerovibrio sp. JC8]
MKKTLVSALTTALVVGAASTTFAAANPFADVPADHWAYDAVSELQAKGVVNGYAVDNTFRGNQNMTRYEMAQIVAKAMAKVETGDAATKAMVDKLAAEFRDELANLGVRMDDLEARMDNVKHSGFIRYRWDRSGGNNRDGQLDEQFIRFRLNSAMKINEKVDGFARVEWNHNVNTLFNDDRGARVQQLWVHGKVGTTDIYAGRENPNDHASFVHGLVFDTEITGAQVTFNKAMGKDGKVSWTLDAGKTEKGLRNAMDAQARILGTNVNYANGKFDANLGYYNFSNGLRQVDNSNSVGVWGVGLGYKAGDFYITGDYAHSNKELNNMGKDAYNIQVNYKGAKASQPKSWGAYVGYQKLSPTASPFATYDTVYMNDSTVLGTKGWKIGVDYAFMKNIVGSIQYFDGKVVNRGGNDKAKKIFTQVTFSF